MAKISKSYILTPPHPQGQVMSEKCEEPIDELIVQVWLLYHHPNFKYCTLFVSGTELQTFQAGGIKITDLSGRGHKNYEWVRIFSNQIIYHQADQMQFNFILTASKMEFFTFLHMV